MKELQTYNLTNFSQIQDSYFEEVSTPQYLCFSKSYLKPKLGVSEYCILAYILLFLNA